MPVVACSRGRQGIPFNNNIMKKLFIMLLMLPMFVAAKAQFHVGAEVGRILNDDNPYWQVSATGSYTRHLFQDLSLDANAALFYQNVDQNSWIPYAIRGHTFGGSIGVNAILRVGGPISLFTGPKVQCNFVQKDYYMHRANLQWRVGLQADFWRLRLRASWDILCTNRASYGPKGSLLSVGVAWAL